MNDEKQPLEIELRRNEDDGMLQIEFRSAGRVVAWETGPFPLMFGNIPARLLDTICVSLGAYDPELVAMIRDVADQEIARVGGECWREAFEDIMRSSSDVTAKHIAARALGPKPEGEANA